MKKTIFTKAYELVKNNKIKKETKTENFGELFKVQGKTGVYDVRLFRKHTSWFQMCGCRVGVFSTWNLCKHGIANIVKRFLEENDLELVEKKNGKTDKNRRKISGKVRYRKS